MDNDVFDGLARRIANRRGAIQALAGLLALPAAGLARSDAGARNAPCRKAGTACSRQRKCCNGARCAGGRCKCKAGLTACAGRCVNIERDPANCGRCNDRCPQGKVCNEGVCCAPGASLCNGACCESGQTCVPAHDDLAATCCAGNLVFVLCPNDRIVFDPTTGSSYCDMDPAQVAALEQTCCPAANVCSGDGLCCLDPETNAPADCNSDGFCPLFGTAAASYTPPVKGRN